MGTWTELARRAPLASFLVLAFAFTWALLPLAARSIPVSLVALCGPAVSALVVSAIAGRERRAALGARLAAWSVPAVWYALALLLPLPVTALRSGIEQMLGAEGAVRLQPVTALGLVVFVLVAGEEIGWRGFALPLLRLRYGRAMASVVLGAWWALWHLPLFFMPAMPQFGSPFPAFVLYTVALSMILTVLAERTRGSVPIATLFHGAVNTFGIVHPGAPPEMRGWTNALAYGLAALLLAAVSWRRGAGARASSRPGTP